MTKMKSFLLAMIVVGFSSLNALALDQVILKSGEIVEGKVLSDVPNRHVDIQLKNGKKMRYPQTQVASVERDIPASRAELQQTMANDSVGYFGVVLGGFYTLSDASNKTVLFSFGAKLGGNVAQIGDTTLSIMGMYTRESQNQSGVTATANDLLAGFMFRKIAGTGFMIGPVVGLMFGSVSIAGLDFTTTLFQYGVDLGYEVYLSDSFSIGPELQVVNTAGGTVDVLGTAVKTKASTDLKFLAAGTFHF